MTPRPLPPEWRTLMETLPRPLALPLDVRRTGPAEARVTGGKAPHRVTWDGGALRCDCRAFAYRPHLDCKHILAVRLRRGDRAAWGALREAVAA